MKKNFDAVEWMRQRRIEIDKETEGCSWEARSQRIQDSLKGDPLWERIRDRTVSCGPYTTVKYITSAKEGYGEYNADTTIPKDKIQ
ncbi:MAG TPA: hypothetical protein PLI09_05520 [Candidatus Hydrogenedentes bacterium]|nr:hypothetical protein [Candidatus Hydrogenedentota bacterium]